MLYNSTICIEYLFEFKYLHFRKNLNINLTSTVTP